MWTKSRGSRALTVASVPTGMKAGVSTFPCTVENTPARAAPLVASISNEKLIVFEANRRVSTHWRWRIKLVPSLGGSWSYLIVPCRSFDVTSFPSKCEMATGPGGNDLVDAISRCTASPLTDPVALRSPLQHASPYQLPVPETVEPLTLRLISQLLSTCERSRAHLPLMSLGPRSEHPIGSSTNNNTDTTERIGTSVTVASPSQSPTMTIESP